MAEYLDDNGLLYFWSKIKSAINNAKVTVDAALSNVSTNPVQNNVINSALGNKVDKINGKGLSTNDYTSDEKTKLSGIAAGAEVNQNAFTKIKVGSTTISADSKTDTFEFVAGTGVTLTPDATNDKLTIDADGASYSPATTSADGLMSSSDKTKLDALPTNSTLQSTYATKSEITGMYKYKGSVANASALPSSGQEVGDVYNIEAASTYGGAGANVAWNGSAWDSLGEIFQITAITNAEIDTVCAT